MTSRRKFLALLGFGAGAVAATVAIAKQHPKPPPPKFKVVGFDGYNNRTFIGIYDGVPVYRVDALDYGDTSLLKAMQKDYNERRSLYTKFFDGQQWQPEQISSITRDRLEAGTPIVRNWRFS